MHQWAIEICVILSAGLLCLCDQVVVELNIHCTYRVYRNNMKLKAIAAALTVFVNLVSIVWSLAVGCLCEVLIAIAAL